MDSQRSAVYAAENMLLKLIDFSAKTDRMVRAFGSTVVVPPELRFGTLHHVQEYVNHVMNQAWCIREFGYHPPITVRARRGNRAAHYCGGVIAINDTEVAGQQWAMRELVVLHEVAHHFTTDNHGPQFALALLVLIENQMSPEVAFLLRCAFGSQNVKVAPHKFTKF